MQLVIAWAIAGALALTLLFIGLRAIAMKRFLRRYAETIAKSLEASRELEAFIERERAVKAERLAR